jgi:hypothetical protein
LVKGLDITHPYGVISPMPWADRMGVSFGADVSGSRLLQMSSQIKTFTERVEDESSLFEIRKFVLDAETIVFLGFAFHELNMQLIRPDQSSKAKRVFGTAWNVSGSDCLAIHADTLALLGRKSQHVRIELRNNLKCAGLFREYWRTLSRKE